MGKKGNWFSAVKKALTSESKEKRDKKTRRSKGWFGRQKSQDLDALKIEPAIQETPVVEEKLTEPENEQNKHVYSVAIATAVAEAAAEVAWLANVARHSSKSKEEIAAIKIQTAFRGYMARRAFRALKGLVRLKTMIQRQSVKRQATVTLRCMQTLTRVQSEIRARRIRMSDENESFQRQVQQKLEKDREKLEKMKPSIGDNWNDSPQSKEQIEAKLKNKHDAAIRREKALAYAFTHQQTWRNIPISTKHTFMDPNTPHWGWSWLERWMASRPWEPKTATENETNSERASAKTITRKAVSAGEFQRANSYHEASPSAHRQSRTPSQQSPSTPHSKPPNSSMGAGKMRSPSTRRSNDYGMDEDSRSPCTSKQLNSSMGAGKLRSPSTRSSNDYGMDEDSRSRCTSKQLNSSIGAGKLKSLSTRSSNHGIDEDSRSMCSAQSEYHRRHSITGSSVRDDESLASSPAVPSYMSPTKSAKAKSKVSSALGLEKKETPERGSIGSTKKRLSFSGSPAPTRRLSSPS